MTETAKSKFREHLVSEKPDACLICDHPMSLIYTDLHGEARCWHCGLPYQTRNYMLGDEAKKEFGLTDSEIKTPFTTYFEIVPMLREYWAAKHVASPFGTWLGKSPVTKEAYESFHQFLLDNAERLSAEYPESFQWDELLAEKAGTP